MKRFIRTLIVYILIVAGIIALINVLYAYQDSKTCSTMSLDRQGEPQIKDVPDTIDICNCGSSHGLSAFDYEDWSNYNCFNFALGSQFPSYDYRILQNFENCFHKGTVVFLPISHFSLFGIREEEYPNFESLNKRYYKFMGDDLIKAYNPKTDFIINYLPAFSAGHTDELLKVLFGVSGESIWQTNLDPEKADEHGYVRYVTFVKSKLAPDGSRLYNEEEIQAVYDIIDFCKSRDMRVVLLTTPFYSSYNEAVKKNDPEFLEDYHRLLGEIIQNTGVEYYDFSEDPRFVNDPTLFCNSDHLNRDGARLFTEILFEEVLKVSPGSL